MLSIVSLQAMLRVFNRIDESPSPIITSLSLYETNLSILRKDFPVTAQIHHFAHKSLYKVLLILNSRDHGMEKLFRRISLRIEMMARERHKEVVSTHLA